jgi:hypothetical protein
MPAPRKPVEQQLAGISIAARSNPKTFKSALNRLGSDNAFRDAVMKDPTTLTKDFNLSIRELQALRQVAILSGVDAKVIDVQRAKAIQDFAARGAAAEIDVNVSCCCCCCCGETAVIHTAPAA